MTAPQELAAQQYMEHKGLGQHRPYDIERVDDVYVWYFSYRLPEGRLELEVQWTPERGWEVETFDFETLTNEHDVREDPNTSSVPE